MLLGEWSCASEDKEASWRCSQGCIMITKQYGKSMTSGDRQRALTSFLVCSADFLLFGVCHDTPPARRHAGSLTGFGLRSPLQRSPRYRPEALQQFSCCSDACGNRRGDLVRLHSLNARIPLPRYPVWTTCKMDSQYPMRIPLS